MTPVAHQSIHNYATPTVLILKGQGKRLRGFYSNYYLTGFCKKLYMYFYLMLKFYPKQCLGYALKLLEPCYKMISMYEQISL